jgi:acetyl esterase/lipase
MIKIGLVVLNLLMLTGCTTLGLFLANLPVKLSDTIKMSDISYGDKSWQTLDIYIPKSNSQQKKLPVIVFFYGGSWEEGHKEMYPFIGKAFSDRGYITVIADYGKYPEVQFPEFIEDGAKAVAWTYNTISEYGGDPNHLYLAGHSAGAYIAAMINTNTDYLHAHDVDSTIIKAFVGLSGPYDFVPNTEALKAIFKPTVDNYNNMQVSTFVTGNEPPMLLIWGEKDEIVYRRNLDLFSAAIRQKNGRVETLLYPEMNHVDMVKNMMWMIPSDISIVDDVTLFFDRY